ncbi:nonsense-mediated mRNA decay factor SMG7 isoform X1 [Syngnathus scovelli]|uniref:nonsense-mediated mRNA decay factor SMG7 isoform X1 n=1 Tax=Syngnathus scovelli TaxID=161590 RepID=UPI0021101D27|nr:nonsense-mediated mRNA decay factor SMG7 isoform X1 [Syngnathus scovelli]
MSLCAHFVRQAEALKADMTDSKLAAAEAWTSRQALQDLYQKMLVTDLEYALDKKVEQDLWNHAFKNQITTLQSQAKNRANPNRSEVQANLSLFLEAASGFYTQLLQELCSVFNVDLPCRVKSSRLGILGGGPNGSSIVTPQPSSCSYICQHCLVHLGDIARYRNQTSQAESYYRHAAQLVPSNGQPYNQLAILASSKGDHLTTIFYYCRSIAVKFPFPAASTNLQKALSKALESREESRGKWSVSDFVRAFIKFHGHVYMSKGLEQLDALRQRLEEQFQRLILQKAFTSQQLVHVTVINLFALHHLRETAADGQQTVSWFQLLGLFMSFLGLMCSRVLLNKNHGSGKEEEEEVAGECPLPAIKVSLDWLRLKPGVFHEPAVDQRQHIWPWLVSILNSFQPKDQHVSTSSVTPLPEEFELQGFLALRPALRSVDFSKGHQGVPVDRDVLLLRTRHQRLVVLGKWIADNQPGLIQCRASEDGLLLFLSDIPEQAIQEPAQEEPCVLQEASNGEGGIAGLKSVLSVGKAGNAWADGAERPVVTFKENIKPREQSREPARLPHQRDVGKERRDSAKGNGLAPSPSVVKSEPKRDGKRKCETKKPAQEKVPEAGKQVKAQTELRKTPVTQPQAATCAASQFIPIHHPGAFPPLPSRPGFPPSTFVIPSPPVAFPGLQVNPGFAFSAGVSVPGAFLQAQAGSQAAGGGGKPSHIPYSQQRPSGPGASVLGQQQPQMPHSQLQVSSPGKPVQPFAMAKSPPHLQQAFVQDAQLWSPSQAALQKLPPSVQMSLKSQNFYLTPQDTVKVYEHQVAPPPAADKQMKFPPYWDAASFRPPDDRTRRPPEQDMVTRGGGPFEGTSRSPLLPPDLLNSLAADVDDRDQPLFSKSPDLSRALSAPLSSLAGPNMFLPNHSRQTDGGLRAPGQSSSLLSAAQEYNQNSIFSQAYGKKMAASSKCDTPSLQQETSLYSLFEWTPWSPSLPASSDHSTPASQSPHSSNPSSLPSSPSTHNHAAAQAAFSNFGPIGAPDSRERRAPDRWKADKTGGTSSLGLDYLPAATSDAGWHQAPPGGSSWANQESPMEESSSSVLLDSFKSIWSSSMMQSGPSALEQLLLQQKQKQQREYGAMNPPH